VEHEPFGSSDVMNYVNDLCLELVEIDSLAGSVSRSL